MPLSENEKREAQERRVEHAREHERLEGEAAAIVLRTRVPVTASVPYDFDAAGRGLSPFHRDTWRKVKRGERLLPIACRLGPECETWLIAASRLADEMGLPWRAELPPSRELSFQVKVPERRAREFEDAFRRLAAKFNAHLNVYYAGSKPWGLDVSRSVYHRD